MTNFNVLIFDGFETLDVFGPVEVAGALEEHFEIRFYSEKGGVVESRQKVKVVTLPMDQIRDGGVLFIPGGMGTRREVNNKAFLEAITDRALKSEFVLTVCTGSGLLAKTGLLSGKRATSNKFAFDWAVSQDPSALWVRKARWCVDGKYYTSSGVSAGIDMALGFVRDRMGREAAERVARHIEYVWNSDRENDPFC